MTENDATPPETWLETSPQVLEQCDAWIAAQHPNSCTKALERLAGLEGHDATQFSTATQRLLAHCLREHMAGVPEIVRVCANQFIHRVEETGLLGALQQQSARLGIEAAGAWSTFVNDDSGDRAANLLLSGLDGKAAQGLWDKLHAEGFIKHNPRPTGRLLRAAGHRRELATRIRAASLAHWSDLSEWNPSETVFVLVHGPNIRSRRDGILAKLFATNPSDVANLIVGESTYAKHPPRIVERATKWLLKNDPGSRALGQGLGVLLRRNPAYAVPVVARILNASNAVGSGSQELEHAVTRGPQRRLFEFVARDAIRRGPMWSSLLASRHRRIFTRTPVVVAWIRRNMRNPRNRTYIAQVLIEYLSHPTIGDAATSEHLAKLATRLHTLHGTTRVESVLRGWDLNPKPEANKPVELGLALAHDVAAPPIPVNVERMIRTYKRYPETWKTLGGESLQRSLRQGRLPPNYHYYNVDVPAQRRGLQARKTRGSISDRAYTMKTTRLSNVMAARERWEKRFAKLAHAKPTVRIPSALLREDRFAWSEVRLASLLVDHFTVIYEPANRPGFGTKKPDFWLQSPDGDLYFEVQAINRRRGDLRTGGRSSTGGDAKKRLQSKIQDKFHDGVPDFGLPIVIGLQADSLIDLDFDFENSLYGQLQSTILLDNTTHQALGDGTTRATENAFFNEPRSRCISAVAGIAVEDSADARVEGELYRPIPPTKYPLSARLWLRLRTALFGSRPPHLVDAMARLPGITRAEAEALVDHGVDEPSFFANDWIPRPPELPMTDARFQELREATTRRQALAETNQIRFLEASSGTDLKPLYNTGIVLVDQLLRAKDPPPGMDLDAWQRLRTAAQQYRPSRIAGGPA